METVLHEKEMWLKFYVTFNDDNMRRAEQAYNNNIAVGEMDETVESLRAANIRWVQEILDRGTSMGEMLALMPESAAYLASSQNTVHALASLVGTMLADEPDDEELEERGDTNWFELYAELHNLKIFLEALGFEVTEE